MAKTTGFIVFFEVNYENRTAKFGWVKVFRNKFEFSESKTDLGE